MQRLVKAIDALMGVEPPNWPSNVKRTPFPVIVAGSTGRWEFLNEEHRPTAFPDRSGRQAGRMSGRIRALLARILPMEDVLSGIPDNISTDSRLDPPACIDS
ncbi:uncharacterized protein MCYG_04654 [Microsporum canis CBS 113480]|uniref:Uncharacterized protein n=1 Tax=Arthroderma otae (strain ATCC MYA-4605 / CBS 113480) TaxID=554155 RepID=C5FNY2_ARTOC|nr:uncharacterized protein MCYG_04654 [Microsporum canis CBS 113480]EEQ31835.1 predicted protein [Microsporum canis CBS 113480]